MKGPGDKILEAKLHDIDPSRLVLEVLHIRPLHIHQDGRLQSWPSQLGSIHSIDSRLALRKKEKQRPTCSWRPKKEPLLLE
jgi:hypothetical protein